MIKLTNDMLKTYLEFITGCSYNEFTTHGYLKINSAITMDHEVMYPEEYETYKRSIKFIDENFEKIASGLQSEDIFVKKECAKVLGCFYDKRSIEPLIASLVTSNKSFRRVCIKSLIKIKIHSREPLIKALKSPVKNIQRGALVALGKLRDKNLIGLFIDLITDKDWNIRFNVVKILINLGSPDAIDPICNLITDPSVNVRKKAAQALKYLHCMNRFYNLEKKTDLPEFIRCYELISKSILIVLNDENSHVREKAMISLRYHNDFNAFSEMYPHLKDLEKRIEIKIDLTETLLKGSKNFAKNTSNHIMELKKFSEELEREIMMDMSKYTKKVLKVAKDKNKVLSHFLDILKKYDKGDILPYVNNALSYDNFKVRKEAVFLLGKLKGRNTIPQLKKAFKDENPEVRKESIRSLARLNDESWVPFIKNALKDTDESVREQAAYFLPNEYKTNELNFRGRNTYILEDIPSKERKSFEEWLSNLHNKIYLNIKDNQKYIYIFLYDVISKFCENKDMKNLNDNFDLIEKVYPREYKLQGNLNNWRSGAYFYLEKYDEALFYKKKVGLTCKDLFLFSKSFKKPKKELLDGCMLLKIIGDDNLTDFGKKHAEEIEVTLNEILDENYNKYNQHLISHLVHDYNISSLSMDDLNSLKKYFNDIEEYSELKFQYLRGIKWLFYGNKNQEYGDYLYFRPFPGVESKRNVADPSYRYKKEDFIPTIIIKAFLNHGKKIIREAENRVRNANNLPKVGQGWINETRLFNRIKMLFPNEVLVQHGKPSWLGQQHLDIFFKNKNIGIEYQGEPHQGPVTLFGGEEKFKEQKERDKRKKRLCDENKCKIIYVYPSYNIKNIEKEIKILLKYTC